MKKITIFVWTDDAPEAIASAIKENISCSGLAVIDPADAPISPKEALYGFAAWLLLKEGKTVFSQRADKDEIFGLVEQFTAKNNIQDIRMNWPELISTPLEEEAVKAAQNKIKDLFPTPGDSKTEVLIEQKETEVAQGIPAEQPQGEEGKPLAIETPEETDTNSAEYPN